MGAVGGSTPALHGPRAFTPFWPGLTPNPSTTQNPYDGSTPPPISHCHHPLLPTPPQRSMNEAEAPPDAPASCRTPKLRCLWTAGPALGDPLLQSLLRDSCALWTSQALRPPRQCALRSPKLSQSKACGSFLGAWALNGRRYLRVPQATLAPDMGAAVTRLRPERLRMTKDREVGPFTLTQVPNRREFQSLHTYTLTINTRCYTNTSSLTCLFA